MNRDPNPYLAVADAPDQPAAPAAEKVEVGTMTGGAALAYSIAALHDGPLFGMAGFQLATYYETIRTAGLTHWLINDERSAMFAADAWARVTNRPAVVDGTMGPGATNLVCGLAESLNAGIPVVVVTGDAHRLHAGKNLTQEGRQVEILRPVVKALLRVEHVSRIPELVARAFELARRGRPGPVVVDIPEDIAHETAVFPPEVFECLKGRGKPLPIRASARDTLAAANVVSAALRPVLLVGGGIHLSQAYAELAEFARSQRIPVAHTLSGKGGLPCDDTLALGVFGRYSRIANELIKQSDCLIVVGCKLGEIATRRFTLLPKDVPVVQIDIEPEEFGRTGANPIALWADAKEGLNDLRLACTASAGTLSARAERVAQLAPLRSAWRTEASSRMDSEAAPVNIARLLRAINEALPPDGVLVADGGFAAHWSGLFFDTRAAGRGFIANRGFASIGYGLPAAIGAQLAAGKRRVIALTGDGGLNMSLGELESARRVGAPFVLVVLNNAASGYVKAMQHAMFGAGAYQSSELSEVDYAALARVVGIRGIRVERPSQLDAAFAEALAHTVGPTLIDVIVTRDPAQMLPGLDERGMEIKAGDRPI
jgi:acetolactate synthase-1/2/3 large subunit